MKSKIAFGIARFKKYYRFAFLMKGEPLAVANVSNRLTACLIFIVVGTLLWIHHPLFYNADGYEYFVQGFDPLNNLNPHHLLWIPLVGSVIALARRVHLDPVMAVQLFGVMATALAAASTALVLNRLPIRKAPLIILLLFVFLGPWLWLLSTQNQPYPLLILIASLLMLVLAPPEDKAISMARLWTGTVLVATAIGLNEAALLWIPAIGFYLWTALDNRKRVWRVLAWCAGTGLVVIVGYAWAIWIQGFHTWADLTGWLTEYLHDQHRIEFHLATDLLQSTIGLTKVFFQTGPIDARLFSHVSAPSIAGLYAILFIGILAVGAWWLQPLPNCFSYRRDRALRLSVTLLASWSVFCVLWEPNNYYWCVVLCPFLYATVGRFRSTSWLLIFLILATGWNVDDSRHFERYYEQGAPSVLLPELMADLSPDDRYVIIYESRPRAVDYSLLADSLTDRHRANQVSLVDDFILPSGGREWSRPFDDFLNKTWAHHGKVYVAVQLLDPQAYRLASGILASYDVEEVANLQPDLINQKMSEILARYPISPSHFHIGPDRFFELSTDPKGGDTGGKVAISR